MEILAGIAVFALIGGWFVFGRRARHLSAWRHAANDLGLDLRGDRIEGVRDGVSVTVRTVATDSGELGTEIEAVHSDRMRVTAARGPTSLDLGDPEAELTLRGEVGPLLAVLDRDARADLARTTGLRIEAGKVLWRWPGVESHSIRLRKRALRAIELAVATAASSLVRRLAERVHDGDEPAGLRAKALSALVQDHHAHDDTTSVCLTLVRTADAPAELRGPALVALARRGVPIVRRAAVTYQSDPALKPWADKALAALTPPPHPR